MRSRIAITVCLVACSNSSPQDDGGTDATADVTVDAPEQEAGKDASTGCNALANIGTVIPQTFVAQDGVTGDGGAIAPGTYVLTAAAVYTGIDGGTGPTGTTFQDTVLVEDAGSAYERVVSIANDAGADGSAVHQNGTFVLNGGGSITLTQTCPPGSGPFTSYDSNGTKLHIYAPAAGQGNPALMQEYTKQ